MSPSHNLPAPRNRFVGRQEEIVAIERFLDTSRLVTLSGPPGIGKTRLALEAARRRLDADATLGATAEDDAHPYPHGVWLVELAGISGPEHVVGAVAAALSVREPRGTSLREAVLAHLRRRRLLLLIDNCEHVVVACAQLVDAALAAAPGLSVLATSQEPLAIPGEVVLRVPPLALPPGGGDAPAGARGEEADAPACDSVGLFLDRARAIRPDFHPDDDDRRAVAEICRRLDGLPLAIELAASRVDVLPPGSIAQRLEDRFGLLTSGSRAALPRQRTLRAALDWSFELLSESDGALFRRLGVFAGSFPLEAAEEVCGGGAIEPADILEGLGRLVAKSLVLHEGTGQEPRYRLLETIRTYARERLIEAGEAAELRIRSAAWCASLVALAAEELTGPDQRRWLERLEAEHDNLRAAVDWAVADGHVDLALRLCGGLVLFWRMRSHFREGRDRLAAVLAVSAGAPAELRAGAVWGLGFLTAMLGGYAAALPLVDEALTLARQVGDDRLSARALLVLGNASLFVEGGGDPLPHLERSAELARTVGDDWCLAHALAVAGSAHNLLGQVEAAGPLLDEAVAVARRTTDQESMLFALNSSGYVALSRGDYGRAESDLLEALGLARDLGETYETAGLLADLAAVALGRGDYSGAEGLAADSLSVAHDIGSAEAVVHALLVSADIALARRDPGAARAALEEAQAVARAAKGRAGPAVSGLGEAALVAGDTAAARPLLEEALSAAQQSGYPARVARAQVALGHLARAEGDEGWATSLYRESLLTYNRIGDLPGVARSLEALAGLALASTGGAERAARMFGAASALREAGGYARHPVDAERYDHDVAALGDALSSHDLDEAWSAGASLSPKEAVAYATRGRAGRGRPATGWEGLTPAERNVVALVAEGLTNPQIAERLFVSRETVKVHLGRVFTKLGVNSRAEVAREATRRAM